MKDKAIKDAMYSIENRIRHVYNHGYEDGLKDGKASVQIDETEAYKLGYENGLTCKEYIQIDESTAYERGLNDAWECARKIMLSDEDGGIALSDILKIFGMTQYSAIKRFSASEAIAKIKEYEDKQKRNCDTCKYGGHTLQDLKKCVYCDGSNYWIPKQTSKMTLDEAIKHCEEVADSKCDECGAEHRQLAEWLRELKQMKGEEG